MVENDGGALERNELVAAMLLDQFRQFARLLFDHFGFGAETLTLRQENYVAFLEGSKLQIHFNF